jgi:hypothetical protein
VRRFAIVGCCKQKLTGRTATVAAFFNPQDLRIICGAYEEACDALRFAFFSNEPATVQKTRTELAKIVLEVAKTGRRNSKAITTEALRRMPPLRAEWRDY